MDHACYRCGSPVEDQTPFCPSCGAPQIRVSPREPRVADSEGTLPPPADSSLSAGQATAHSQLSGIHWKTFFRIAVFPALITGFAFGLPPLGLLIFLGSAVTVVRLYKRRSLMPVRTSQGAQMGAVLGLMSFLVLTIPATLICVLDRNECHQTLTKALNDTAPNYPDPRMQQFMHSLAQSDQGLFGFLALGMVFFLFVMMALGAAGGAITAALTADKPGP